MTESENRFASPDVPDQELDSADELLKRYQHLGIPHFQRGLVWNDDATALLLESLYYGTPCGNIILWQPLQPGVQGEPIEGDGPFELLIVDGQQRIRMLHEVRKDVKREDGRMWCLDLTVEPRVKGLPPDERRRSLFIFAQDPLKTANPRYRHNLIPISVLEKDDPATIREHYGIDGNVEAALTAVQESVSQMWGRSIFNVITLQETDGEWGRRCGIGDIVSLYNRINSAGRRVEEEEIAYATLVRLYAGTTDRIREFFRQVRGEDAPTHDTLLHREKERSFGFKLYLRTFVQTCSYHFARSPGTQGLSFDVIDSPELQRWIDQNQDKVGTLFDRTRDALHFIREVLSGPLCCDDLRMLPDTDCLIPSLQVLIRFPQLATKQHEDLLAYLILRTVLDPERTQKTTLKVVQLIEKTHNAKSCLRKLCESWSDHKKSRLENALRAANTLSDRYVLLLYWLVRRNKARDFSYRNLPSGQLSLQQVGSKALVPAGLERHVRSDMHPEKQHIAPAAKLSKNIFGENARITTSRHPINNVGNLTFISQALNSLTGLGDSWIDPDKEDDKAKLAGHFIQGRALDCYEALRKKDSLLSRNDLECFKEFCEERRKLIQHAFEDWLSELEVNCDRGIERIERIDPAVRLAAERDTAGNIRQLDYPDRVEDALLDMADSSQVKPLARTRKPSNSGDIVLSVPNDKSPRKNWVCLVHLFSAPPRIEIEERDGIPAFDAFRKIMTQEGIVRRAECLRPWVLPCGVEDEATTGRLLERFVDWLKEGDSSDQSSATQ